MLERVRSIRALAWGAVSLATIFLLIEFFDELHYGIEGAALPAIRLDLGLTFAQIGLLLGLPHLIGTLVEPVLMLLGDTHLRKQLVIGGGLGHRLFPADDWGAPRDLACCSLHQS